MSSIWQICHSSVLMAFLFFAQEFTRIVDDLLCELIAEMGITREQFTAACEQSAGNTSQNRIVQQILSVDDFNSFKKMMIKKNMQINEIALQELVKKQEQSLEPAQA